VPGASDVRDAETELVVTPLTDASETEFELARALSVPYEMDTEVLTPPGCTSPATEADEVVTTEDSPVVTVGLTPDTVMLSIWSGASTYTPLAPADDRIVHVPTLMMVTVEDRTVHTDGVVLACVTVAPLVDVPVKTNGESPSDFVFGTTSEID
jgi:hypothetical protein